MEDGIEGDFGSWPSAEREQSSETLGIKGRNMETDDTEDTFHLLGGAKGVLVLFLPSSLPSLISFSWNAGEGKVFEGAVGWGQAQNIGSTAIAWA